MTQAAPAPPTESVLSAHERRAAILTEVVAAICHDLRGPLNAILGWTTILRRAAPESMARGLDVVERNVRLQAWMLEDVSELYRVAGGVELARRDRVDLAALTVGAVDLVRQSLRADITLTREGSDALWVLGDGTTLRTGLRAILTHFGRAHEVSTRVALSVERGAFVVSFTEPRRGQFPFDGLEALARGDDPRGVFTRGAGLALLVAHNAARSHGGEVRPITDGIAFVLPKA
jgi:signal transduction histidine kinase